MGPPLIVINPHDLRLWVLIYFGVAAVVLLTTLGWRFGWDAEREDFADPRWWVRTVCLSVVCSVFWPVWGALTLLAIVIAVAP